jgi:hypothetical protein
MESDDADDELPKKKSKSYKRPHINWEQVLFLVNADEATVDEGEMKIQILSAANKNMDDSRMFRMPCHIPSPTDVGLWKLKTEWTIDGGKTVVKWPQCPTTRGTHPHHEPPSGGVWGGHTQARNHVRPVSFATRNGH